MTADNTLALAQMESEASTLKAQLEAANTEISTLAAEKDDLVVMAAEEVRLAHRSRSRCNFAFACVNMD